MGPIRRRPGFDATGLQHLGVGFVSLTKALGLTTPAGRAMAGILAVFAEFEREILRERVRAGLDHARQQGKRLVTTIRGSLTPSKPQAISPRIQQIQIARRLQISRTSVRRLLAQKKA